MLEIDRAFAMADARTFRIGPIEGLVLRVLRETGGVSIDPFANQCRLATHTNDLDPSCEAGSCMDADVFLDGFAPASVDVLLFDPPYSPRQLKEVYNQLGRSVTADDTKASWWSSLKDKASLLVRPGGRVVCAGWNTCGFGKRRGFTMERILIVTHGGQHNDTLVTVERRARDLLS